MKQANNFILCQQNQTNLVNFISSELSEPSVLFYNDFLDYIGKYTIEDSDGFLEKLNTFHMILLDLDINKWEIYKEPIVKEITPAILMSLNKDKVLHFKEIKAVPEQEEDYMAKLKRLSFNKTDTMKKNLDTKWNIKKIWER